MIIVPFFTAKIGFGENKRKKIHIVKNVFPLFCPIQLPMAN
jgi:hypothetical protein